MVFTFLCHLLYLLLYPAHSVQHTDFMQDYNFVSLAFLEIQNEQFFNQENKGSANGARVDNVQTNTYRNIFISQKKRNHSIVMTSRSKCDMFSLKFHCFVTLYIVRCSSLHGTANMPRNF